jgi:hypothetical protein
MYSCCDGLNGDLTKEYLIASIDLKGEAIVDPFLVKGSCSNGLMMAISL